MASLDALNSAFGVSPWVEDGAMAATQQLDTALTDHRGRVELPAYAMMAESVTSGTFWHSFAEPVGTVQSWLALTAGVRAEVGDRLRATTTLLHSDGAQGTVSLRVANERDEVVSGGLARCVLVGRTDASLAGIKSDMVQTPPLTPVSAKMRAPSASTVAEVAGDGRQILAAIASGARSAGPLSDLLGATLAVDGDTTQLTVVPQPWMANPLGAIQGGVMAAILGQACSYAGQLHTASGQDYSLADVSINFFRSPPSEVPVTVTTTPDKIGRRLGTVTASMTNDAGLEFARATANVRFG